MWTAYFLKTNEAQLKDEETKTKFGPLYADLQMKTTESKYYPLVMTGRRIMFVLIAIIFRGRNYFQVQSLLFLNILYTIYLGNYRPKKYRDDMKLEFFNEWNIQVLCLHMMCFTDFVSTVYDQKINYKLGDSFKYFVYLMIIVNMIRMVKAVFNAIRLRWSRRQYRKHLKESLKKKEEEDALELQRQQEKQELIKKKQDEIKKINDQIDEDFDIKYPGAIDIKLPGEKVSKDSAAKSNKSSQNIKLLDATQFQNFMNEIDNFHNMVEDDIKPKTAPADIENDIPALEAKSTNKSKKMFSLPKTNLSDIKEVDIDFSCDVD